MKQMLPMDFFRCIKIQGIEFKSLLRDSWKFNTNLRLWRVQQSQNILTISFCFQTATWAATPTLKRATWNRNIAWFGKDVMDPLAQAWRARAAKRLPKNRITNFVWIFISFLEKDRETRGKLIKQMFSCEKFIGVLLGFV